MQFIRKIKIFLLIIEEKSKSFYKGKKYDHCSTVSFKKMPLEETIFTEKYTIIYILKVFKVTSAKINKKTLKIK